VAAEVRIGVPVLDRKSCLSWNGEGVCSLCAYVCPIGSRAVELVGPQQAPLFHATGCVGCGLCEEACPKDAQAIRIAADPANPEAVREIPRSRIEEMKPSDVSMMPAGLLNTLKKDEILDLLAYVECGGRVSR